MRNRVQDSETITRFLKPSYYAKTKREIKSARAFDPYPRGEVSVYRITGLDKEDIWYIADNFVVPNSEDFKGRCEARADFSAKVVRDYGLDIVPDPDPEAHELHANIVNWVPDPTTLPKEKRDDAKQKWLEAVVGIKDNHHFVLRSDP